MVLLPRRGVNLEERSLSSRSMPFGEEGGGEQCIGYRHSVYCLEQFWSDRTLARLRVLSQLIQVVEP